MSTRARKDRKRAVRNGDTSQKLIKAPKVPTGRYLTRQERDAIRQGEKALDSAVREEIRKEAGR